MRRRDPTSTQWACYASLRQTSTEDHHNVALNALCVPPAKVVLTILLALAILLGALSRSDAAEQLIGTSCSGNKNNVDWDTIGQCVSSTFQRVSPFLAGSIAVGTASLTSGTVLDLGSNTNSMLLPKGTTGQEPSPAVAGMIRWNSTTTQVEVFNGGAWAPLWQTPVAASEAAPSGSGYFVLSGTQWNGNLGGRNGADALCLTELTSTNTGWLGYSTASSNGQLVAAKVHAFLCDNTTCTNLMPLASYYFANAGNSSAGGASFTADSTGLGPGGSSAITWSGSTYFGGTYSYWTNRGSSGSSWSNAPYATSGYSCTNWSSTSAAAAGYYGNSKTTGTLRWLDTTAACSSSLNLICFVNP